MATGTGHNQAVHGNGELFRVAFLAAGIGIAVTDHDGRFLDVNPALAALLDDAPEHLVGRTFREFTHPEDLETELPLFQRAIAGEIDRYQLDKRYRRRDGALFWGRTTVACVRDESGAASRFIGQIEDISEEVSAREALAASEAMFRSAFEDAAVGMMIATPDRIILDGNPAYCELVGRTRDEVIGMSAVDITWPEDRAADYPLLARLQAGEIDSYRIEKRFIRKDGSPTWVRLTLSAVRVDGVLRRVLAQAEDIDDRKRAEEATARALESERHANAALVESARERSEFLAMLAHDFRSPLTAIVGYAELLGMETADEQQRADLHAIVAAADRLTGMVSDMLAAETMDDRLSRLDRQPADLGELAAGVVEEQCASWPGREISLEVEPGLPPAMIDRVEVSRAVTNLLTNALKYSPGGEPVAVAVRRDGDDAEIAVRDHGIGIPADRLERIFQPYERIRSERTSGILGVGLGLPIVRAVARSHGGDAWAESVEGEGSTFHLRLPFAPAAA